MDKGYSVKKIDCGAVILAGGDSKRMGSPKALLEIGGISLIERVVETLKPIFTRLTIVTDRPELFKGLPAQITGDLLIGNDKTPLRGIHAGLSASDLPWQFVVACDMPFLSPGLIQYMAKYAPSFDVVVPRVNSYYQPLHAFYSRSCVEKIESCLQRGCFKITDLYRDMNLYYIEHDDIIRHDPREVAFMNINTWGDYEKAQIMVNQEKEQL